MSETTHPPGDYAIVELFGHTTLVGRITDVERFGTRMLAIEPLFRDTLLLAVLHGGAAVYRLTPCTADVAYAHQPRSGYDLPTSIRCIAPPLLLATPPDSHIIEESPDDDDPYDDPSEHGLD